MSGSLWTKRGSVPLLGVPSGGCLPGHAVCSLGPPASFTHKAARALCLSTPRLVVHVGLETLVPPQHPVPLRPTPLVTQSLAFR